MSNLQSKDLDRLSQIMTELAKAKNSKAEQNVIKNKLIDFFRETGLKSYKTDELVIRFVEERYTNQFSEEKLQSLYPEIWKECHDNVKRPPHISIVPIKAASKEPEA